MGSCCKNGNTLILTASANSTSEERSCKLTVTCYDKTAELVIYQKSKFLSSQYLVVKEIGMINNDFELVQALLKHDEVVTREFFYKNVIHCLSLFMITIIQIVLLAWSLSMRYTFICFLLARKLAFASWNSSSFKVHCLLG